MRLGLLAISPVYYQAPLYRRLAADPRLDFTAIFASDGGVAPHEFGYGRPVAWDPSAVEGYKHIFLRNAHRNEVLGSSLSIRDVDVVPLLVRRRFDVLWLQGYNYVTHVLATATQRALSGKVVFREEQTLIHPRPLVKTLIKEVVLRALFRHGPAMYLGIESRRWFEHYGVPSDRLVFAPYAINNEEFARDTSQLAAQRPHLLKSFGLPPDQPVLLTVSRLVPSKQPDAILRAFARVRATMPCSLLIVGAGELEPQLRREVVSNRIPDVAFAGMLARDRIFEAYACADVFVLFSLRDETWGLVVNEAAAAGLPIVVSENCGSARDLVREGHNGYVIDPRALITLERRLTELLGDPTLRRRLGQEGRRVVSSFSYEAAGGGIARAVEIAVGPERWAQACRALS